MSNEIHRVVIQIKAPRGTYGGEVAIGHYWVADGFVVLTDETGRPSGMGKRYIGDGGDPHLLACVMIRNNHRKVRASSDFNRKLSYPKLVY